MINSSGNMADFFSRGIKSNPWNLIEYNNNNNGYYQQKQTVVVCGWQKATQFRNWSLYIVSLYNLLCKIPIFQIFSHIWFLCKCMILFTIIYILCAFYNLFLVYFFIQLHWQVNLLFIHYMYFKCNALSSFSLLYTLFSLKGWIVTSRQNIFTTLWKTVFISDSKMDRI